MSNNDKENRSASRQQELDDFWDISSLVVKPARTPSPARSRNTSAVEVDLALPTNTQSASTTALAADTPLRLHKQQGGGSAAPTSGGISPEQEATTYRPDHPLIEEVTLHPWRNSFPYYERFCHMARAFQQKKGTSAATHVPFFSYMPQYDQMNRAQTEWYLYLRDCVRKGEYPQTDYSYIFLLVFEIINLPDVIEPEVGLSMMCDLWRNYHKLHPILDRYFCEWICDYCLVHQLSLSKYQLADEIIPLAQEAQLREFYVGASGAQAESDALIYLRCCSNYDYKKSKVYRGNAEHAVQMDLHIPSALRAVLKTVTPEHRLFESIKMQTTALTRDAFVGALCSYRIKKKIELRYRSFSRSHELRFFITDVVKYSENKLRAVLGLKSRLSIYALPEVAKKAIDAYFLQVFPKSTAKKTAESRPEYERLYDSPAVPMSSEEAQRIEEHSWQVTKQLVEAFEDEAPDLSEKSPIEKVSYSALAEEVVAAEINHQPQNSNCWLSSNDRWIGFVRFALENDTVSQQRYCREISKMPESLADEINEAALEIMGDIVLEQNDDGGFSVIEEYRQEIAEMIN
ncbi:MAG: TerB N-terminal domain-containing protein [Clostridia bacterium]|nr:TerB N-terminal domain-containing protein [Clostridia bacterium]